MHRLSLSVGVAFVLLALLAPLTSAQCELARLVASDGLAGDELGNAVSISGDHGFIGAAAADDLGNRSGAVYVIERLAGGWAVTDKLLASDGSSFQGFGMSVAVDGDRALVGAGYGSNGAAYAFERTPSGWVEVQKLVATDVPLGGSFGTSVFLSGERALVGAESNNSVVEREGAVYVYERDAAGWSQVAKLFPPDGLPYDWFGGAVAMDGDVIAVGARGHAVHGFTRKGAVYIFEKRASGWPLVQKLTIYAGNEGDHLGSKIAMEGGKLLCVAPGAFSPAGTFGVAYSFRRTPSGWVEEEPLFADGQLASRLSGAVVLSGDRAIIGGTQPGDITTANTAVYVYRKTASGWRFEHEFVGSGDVAYPRFGRSIAFSGDTVLIGATGGGDVCSNDYTCDSGAGFIFSVPLGSTQNFCPAAPNSSGQAALLSISGCARVDSNDLRLIASPVPDNKPGIFFYGDRGIAPTPFGDGFRCTGGRVFRLPLVQATQGALTFTVDLTSPPQATGQITAGSTWFFQAYFRDTAAGGAGFNLSDAIEVLFN